MASLGGVVVSNASSIGEKQAKFLLLFDFGICGGRRVTEMALGSFNHIGFATSMVLWVLGGLWYPLGVHRLELQH